MHSCSLLLVLAVIPNVIPISVWEAYHSDDQRMRREGMLNTRFRPVLHLRGEDDYRSLQKQEVLFKDEDVDENGVFLPRTSWNNRAFHQRGTIRAGGMAAPPRYAFIALDPDLSGTSKRDLFISLAQFGDVKLMSRISEVASHVTDLVRNLENAAGKTSTILVSTTPTIPQEIIMCRPSSVIPRNTPTGETRPPFGFSSQLSLPKLAASSELFNQDGVEKTEYDSNGMVSVFKTDCETMELSYTKEHFDATDSSQIHHEGKYDETDNVEDSYPFLPRSSTDRDTRSPSNLSVNPLRMYADDEGKIELPYNPQFNECRPRRPDDSLEKLRPNQAQCGVCKRWVKVTTTCTRLIAHVFLHTKKERYVCPIEDCGYSNKVESIARRHINTTHGKKMNPIDFEKDKKSQSISWKEDRCKWAPRCFPDHFEAAAGGNLFMRVNEEITLMEGDSFTH
ncbi:hypothetical protein PRIPAC_96824 [Pristionchus pacificus]|uniref:Uncharacterized protein n=1 Tax=Pristionchus pacificus TaxID=54126 RepID=A0A2A6BK54_PRIPA|nr:hypothetical protein PRIPAC_96824 [Pristionchus pacificus]|eukprot:PDM66171.1 hypothetical protein PRIPAC_45396 [Pristionchus pacificus]